MEQTVRLFVPVYIIVMSLIGFIMMGTDKRRAVRHAWRIPEKTLILQAFLGGGVGTLLAMYTFRHKTKHRKFIILVPLAAVLSLAILVAAGYYYE